jgi:hypothetical protein
VSCRKHQTLPFSALVSPFSSAFERCFGARGPRKLQLTRLEFSGNFVPASVAPISLATTATEWPNKQGRVACNGLYNSTFNSTLAVHPARCFGLFLDGWTSTHFHIGITA